VGEGWWRWDLRFPPFASRGQEGGGRSIVPVYLDFGIPLDKNATQLICIYL
jgi:hypothetical protein